MKKILIALIVTACIGFVVFSKVDKPIPDGIAGAQAEELADKMLAALNKQAFDTTNFISWRYMKGDHYYEWEKDINRVTVSWEDMKVQFTPDDLEGTASSAGQPLAGDDLQEAINLAWEFYANDSFWLVAPYKINDAGTERKLVDLENGQGLLITYASGGVTPGDSYLWILDENYRPTAWRMWTQKVPIGGVEFSWDDWNSYNGFWLASAHEWLISVDIQDIVAR